MKLVIENGYIVSIQSEGDNDSEYNEIIKVLNTAPAPREGYGFRLKADTLEWEEYELPIEDEPTE